MTTVARERVVRRVQLQPPDGAFSGAWLERVTFAGGRTLVLKHLPPEGDWLTRIVGGGDRPRRLWEEGTLDEAAGYVDHAIVDVIDGAGTAPHDVIVMNDVTDLLLRLDLPVSRATSRKLLRGLASLHDAWEGRTASGWCEVDRRYRLFAPEVHAADDGPNAHPKRDLIPFAWSVFFDQVPREIADLVAAVHADPALLARPLAARSPTLLHGDPKLENLGLAPSRTVLLDWGELTGFGPRDVDVVWYALLANGRVEDGPDGVFADYDAAAARPVDLVARDLACIGGLCLMGFRFAGEALLLPTEELRQRSAAQLAWWIERTRLALSRVTV
jgi:hypothetical protein